MSWSRASSSRKFHVIAVNEDGEFKKILYYKGEDLSTIFDSRTSEREKDIELDDDDEEYELALDQDITCLNLSNPTLLSQCGVPKCSGAILSVRSD